jgi:hypothetical protein
MMLATEPSIAGTMQYGLRPYASQMRKVAKNSGLPQAQLDRTAAEIAETCCDRRHTPPLEICSRRDDWALKC